MDSFIVIEEVCEMRSKYGWIAALLICGVLAFSACGSAESGSGAKGESVSVSEEKNETEEKADLEEKYKDILDCLENGDYDGAVVLINAMRPQPEAGTILITADNWSQYLSIEDEYSYTYDAQGMIDEVDGHKVLKMKPEYEGKLVSLTGTIGYEYTPAGHIITSIDKSSGSFEAEAADGGPSNNSEMVSKTEDLHPDMAVAEMSFYSVNGNEVTFGISAKNFEEHEEHWVYYPEEINIVRIEGELVLSN